MLRDVCGQAPEAAVVWPFLPLPPPLTSEGPAERPAGLPATPLGQERATALGGHGWPFRRPRLVN